MNPMAPFQSILYDGPGGALTSEEPAFFADLNLDQVVDAMVREREDYDLKPFFYSPLSDVEVVRYRQEILQDLERQDVFACITAFAKNIEKMRSQRTQAEKLYYRYQQERWFVDAVHTYCEAVRGLRAELGMLKIKAPGWQNFCTYLNTYAESEGFQSLVSETEQVYRGLAAVNYTVSIHGNRVTVDTYEAEPDYSVEVEETFAKFKLGSVKDYRVKFPYHADMDHVQANVLGLVARLYPDVFSALDEYFTRNRNYFDETLRRFDREAQFYLAYLAYIKPLRSAGLPFSYPEISATSPHIDAQEAFDLALASKRIPEKAAVVCNDFALQAPERIFVVTGPNQGGKTTFARMFGQLHYLASLGYPVPASHAELILPDRIFTHFEREEDLATLRGKLDDELVRIHGVLGEATGHSVIIMNESFASTTLQDAIVLGTNVMRQIIDLEALCVYVTFVDELTSLSAATVSMVSTVDRDNPATRTYKIVRRRADGLAYAAALAEKYHLTYKSLTGRIAGRTIAG
jgi:DNA mismatch repair protein MutS